MVVTDDEVDPTLVGIVDAFVGLDAAVEGDDQLEAIFGGIVDAFEGDAVAFLIAVGDVKLDFLLLEERLEIGVDHRYGRGAVNIVIAVNQQLFIVVDGLQHAVDSLVHVLHEERIMQLGERGTEESLGFLVVGDSALDKQSGKVLVYIEHLDNFGNLLFVNRLV